MVPPGVGSRTGGRPPAGLPPPARPAILGGMGEREDYADPPNPWPFWLRTLGLMLLCLVHAIGCWRDQDRSDGCGH